MRGMTTSSKQPDAKRRVRTRSPKRSKKARSRRFKFAAVCLSLLFAALICEIALRVLLGAPLAQKQPVLTIEANPYRGWAMIPNTTHFAYHHPVHINNLGLRGDDVTEKQPDEVRILALGDSMIFGQGIADDQTLPVHMQSQLNAKATDTAQTFTVINGGLRSYSTNQELGLLEELGTTIQPDVVIIFWYWNDVIEHSIPEHNHRFTLTGPVAFDTKQKLEGWRLAKWHVTQTLRRSALIMWLYDSARALQAGEWPRDTSLAAMARLDGYLARFKAMENEHRFKLLLAVIPDPNSLNGEHPGSEYTLLVQALAEKHGIASRDLFADAVKAYDGGIRLPVVPYDGHYNDDANQAMARGVTRFLRRELKNQWPRDTWK